MATSKTGLTTPDLSSTPNVPSDMAVLAGQLDNAVVPVFASSGARDAAISAGATFRLCQVAGVVQVRVGSTWYPFTYGPAVSTLGPITADRTLGTLGNTGTYSAGKPVLSYANYSIQTSDASGLIVLASPAGITALLGLYVTPFYQGAEDPAAYLMVRLDAATGATLTGPRVQTRDTLTGNPKPNVRVGIQFQFIYQV